MKPTTHRTPQGCQVTTEVKRDAHGVPYTAITLECQVELKLVDWTPQRARAALPHRRHRGYFLS